MKIESGRGVASSTGARRAGAAPGFAPTVDAPQRVAASGSVAAATPLDAIMALQAGGQEGERRARQTRRGRAVLDALEGLARGLALGRAPAGLRTELESLRRGAETTGEAGLDSVLREIDTRLAVELAKLEMSLGSA
jgi:hypothetical protein